jgi:glycosyltransferase involved in cell wall biosynthesis
VAAPLQDEGVRIRTTIVNGVGPPPPPADRAALEQEWGVPSDRPLVVAVGRLVEQKDHALAIRALAYVPNATLAILGEGPLRGQLEREAARAGVSARVVFTRTRRDARPIIGAADALVLSSRCEGFALVVLEALAAGTPVVATDVRDVRELLTDGKNCMLVPHGDAEALGRAIQSVLEDRSLAANLAHEGQSLVATYSEDRMVEAYLDLYEELAT